MPTVYDWSPLFDAINGATNKWSQQNQYNSMLNGLIGKQVPGQTNLGLPAIDPHQTSINATAPNIPGAPAPVQRSVNASIPGMAGTAATQSAPTYDGMAGQALGANAAPMLSMLRNAPPGIGLPLLLNLATKNAERQQNIQDARVRPLSDDEAKAKLGSAWKADGKYGEDISGNIITIQKGETMSEAALQQHYGMKRTEGQIAAEAPVTKKDLLEHQDNLARIAATRDAALNNNPFGKGMTGKSYAILAAGAKDPSVRSTPEYFTAWQILSNPHVDPNTGTVVVPDMSGFAPPDGMHGQGGQTGPRMPTIKAFAPPNPSQADAASAGYANRLADSNSQITDNQSALSDMNQRARGNVPLVGNFLTSPQYQKGTQAERNFINAQLRRESGAAIAESEFDNARKQYIPQPGDSKEVLAQKKASRDMAVRNMQLSAGNTLLAPGVFQDASPPKNAPTVPMEQGFGGPGGSKTILRTGTEKGTGRKVIEYSDGTHAYAN